MNVKGVHSALLAGGLAIGAAVPLWAQDAAQVYLGTVRAADLHGLSYGARGCIVDMHPDIDRGQQVAAGQALIQLDDAQSALSLLTAETRVLDLEAAVAERDLALDAARADDRRRQQELALVMKEFERNKTLFGRGLINETALEGVERRLMDARFAAERAQEAIATAGSARKRAGIALEIGRLEHQQAELSHADLTVAAPFDGVLIGFAANTGDCVQEGALAGQIYAPHQKAVDIHVLIDTLAPNNPDGLAIGTEVSIRRAVGAECSGTVTQIGTEANLETQFVKTTIDVDTACAPDLFLNEAVEVAPIRGTDQS